MGRMLGLVFLTAAVLAPAAAVEIIIGDPETGYNLPFCGT